MKMFAGLLALLVSIAVPVFAQDAQESQSAPPAQPAATAEAPKPHEPPYLPKYEASASGSYYSFYAPGGNTLGMLGWNGTFQYNFRRWLAIEGEGFGEYYNQGTNGKTSIYSGLAGGKFYSFGHRKVTLFLHGLMGYGRYRLSFPAFGGFGFSAVDKTSTIYEVGGGLDYNIRKHWGIRMLQGDYDKAGFFSGNQSRASYRLSFGVVYRFGQR